MYKSEINGMIAVSMDEKESYWEDLAWAWETSNKSECGNE